MTTADMRKPVRLELNNSGSWKCLGRFDAGDQVQTELVLGGAESLVKTLHNGGPGKCPTLRVSFDDALGEVLLRWDIHRGWTDAKTRESFW
ncbi:hypothetical protein CKO44_07705 [Rubrivivax gelatinosus]|uniref:hypothetical protein n=1 Tax=Rubrivivax gelatinosus TaxID=28068 RepID=UPI001908F9D7|nr:hypothetical protein [Rubrivivax gelatinosus]MBK1613354.1 hypothetical protein [Rubrivivax gelatinosus]